MTHVRTFLAGVLALIAVTGCAKSSGSGGPTLVIAELVEPNSLNPVLTEGTTSALVGGILYSFLLTLDAHGTQIPDAATAVPSLANGGISRDGLRITYHLRAGLRWSDGQPLTARDCVFTWHAILNPRTNVPTRFAYDKIAEVTAPNDRTVVVRLNAPFSATVDNFLTMQSNYPILPEHNLGRLADLNHADVDRPIVGSGPFTLVEWKHGDHLTFAANPLYFRGRPHIARLIMRIIPEPATIVNELQTHEIDGALSLTDPSLRKRISSIPDSSIALTPANAFIALYFNLERGLLSDRTLRQAIANAIDTDAVMHRATQGAYGSADALRGEFGTDAEPNPQRYDPVAARRQLDAAGWHATGTGVRSKGGHPLTITMAFVGADQLSRSIGLQLKEQLRAVGVDLALHAYSGAMMKAPAAQGGPMFGGRFDLAVVEIYASGNAFSGQFFICAERAPKGFNIPRMCNREVDNLFADIVRSSDPARRTRDARAMQRIFAVEMPQIPLAQLRIISATSNRVHGVVPAPLTPFVGLERWSIDP